jgi:hypothetical protein
MGSGDGGRGRPGRRAAAAGALVAAAGLGAGLVFALLDDRPETRIVTRSPDGAGPLEPDSGSPGSATVPQPGSPGGGRPETIVALSRTEGLVVLLDSGTGGRVRVLATHPPPTDENLPSLQGVALDRDRGIAYYDLAGGCGTGTIYRVPLDGRSPPVAVADGISPAVSPDGRALAYAAPGPPMPEGGPGCHNTLVVRDLGTGEERRWRHPVSEDGYFEAAAFTKLAWAPDSRRLAVTHSYEGDSVSVLDTAVHRDLSEAVEVVVPGGGGDSRHPAWEAGSGRLAVVNSAFECCFEDDYAGPPRALLVDVDRRLVKALLPAGRRPTWLDFDASGEHLLYIEGGRLYRRSGGARPVPVAAGLDAADW